MFDDLPPDLARLLTLRVWHTLWLQRIDAKIAALEEREAEREQGRRNRPAEPDWVVELGIGNGRPPIEVHLGGCYAAGARRRPVPRDEARRLLTSGVRACGHCRPDTALDIADLSAPPAPTTASGRPASRPLRSAGADSSITWRQDRAMTGAGHGRRRGTRGWRRKLPVVSTLDLHCEERYRLLGSAGSDFLLVRPVSTRRGRTCFQTRSVCGPRLSGCPLRAGAAARRRNGTGVRSTIPPAAETLTANCGQSDVRGISWPGAATGAVMSSSSMASWSGVPGSAV
ncbi:DUF6233 domain-containing protein [Streptomyces aureus]